MVPHQEVAAQPPPPPPSVWGTSQRGWCREGDGTPYPIFFGSRCWGTIAATQLTSTWKENRHALHASWDVDTAIPQTGHSKKEI